MEEENIQSRISSLEKHLEDVRKRARVLLTKENNSSDKDSISLSEESPRNPPNASDSDSFSDSSEEPQKIPNFQPFMNPSQNFYPMYYPQPDLRQQLDYLHYQLNQHSQAFAQSEKKWKDEAQKMKEEMIKLKEENSNLKETVKKLKIKGSEPNFKDKVDDLEGINKNLELEKKKLEEKLAQVELEHSKLKSQQLKQKKVEESSKDEAFKHEVKKLNEKVAFLENKIVGDKVLIDNLRKEISKSDDKIANLEDTLIENRNNFSQINKKLSIENDNLKKQIIGLTKPKELKDSDELSKLKNQLYQKNKEIENLKAERSIDEEDQQNPVEIKVNKRKNVLISERLANLKKQNKSIQKEESLSDILEESEEKNDTLENQLIHLQIEKQRLENEYIKLPEFSRNLASKIRRNEVESELDSLTKTIQAVKNKLRSLNLI
jgi:hypothetical protein